MVGEASPRMVALELRSESHEAFAQEEAGAGVWRRESQAARVAEVTLC